MKNIEELSTEDLFAIGSAKWSRVSEETGHHLEGAWIAEGDLGTAPAIEQALHNCVDKCLLSYSPDWARTALRKATKELQGSLYGWSIDLCEVHIAPDVLACLRAFIRTVTSPGDAIVVPTPNYMPFLTIPGELERECVQVPSISDGGHWTLDWDALDVALANQNAKMLVLCNPWNPTGRVLTKEELERFGQLALKHNVYVFSDEIHAPLVYEGHQHIPFASLSEDFARISVTAQAASKGWNIAGLKCAQLIISDPYMLAQFQQQNSYLQELENGASTLGILASTAAYTEGVRWLEETKGYLHENYLLVEKLARELCPGIMTSKLEGTFLSYWDCTGLGLTECPCELLAREAGVAVNAGSCMGDGYPHNVRFNFNTPRHILKPMLERCFTTLDKARK